MRYNTAPETSSRNWKLPLLYRCTIEGCELSKLQKGTEYEKLFCEFHWTAWRYWFSGFKSGLGKQDSRKLLPKRDLERGMKEFKNWCKIEIGGLKQMSEILGET